MSVLIIVGYLVLASFVGLLIALAENALPTHDDDDKDQQP